MVNAKFETIDSYLESIPEDKREILQKIRRLIQEISPIAKEAMSYQIPTFKLQKKNLVHFAAFKDHIGFYPTPSGIKAFKDELKNYSCSKGTIRFPLNKPIPYDLIKKITEYRVRELNK